MENKTTTTKIIDHNGKRPKKTNNNFWYKLNVHDIYKILDTYHSTSKQHCVEQKTMLIPYVFTFVVVLLNIVHPVSARKATRFGGQLDRIFIRDFNTQPRELGFNQQRGNADEKKHRQVRDVASWQ